MIKPETLVSMTCYMQDTAETHVENIDIKNYLSLWEDAKSEYLYNLMGKQFILSKKISYLMDDEEKMELMGKVLRKHDSFIKSLYNETFDFCSYYYTIYNLTNAFSLATNTYNYDEFSITTPTGKKIDIKKGCKTIRMIGKIANAFNVEGFEEFRIAHSQILNQKKLEGELCLSIHPLDYITMSDNDCGWNSCMSWTDSGEYRRGTVEMMNSPMVVVAYLNSNNPYHVYGTDWSNKKWRELFIVSKEIITGVKPYPYYNKCLEEITCNWLKELAEKNMSWSYLEQLFTYKHNYNMIKDHRLNFYTNAMYNDFGTREEGHIGYIGSSAPYNIEKNYSGKVKCLKCGKITDDFDDESCVICEDCEAIEHCTECNSRLYDEFETYYHNGRPYCSYCFENLNVCELCDEIIDVNMDEGRHIYVAKKSEQNDEFYWGSMKDCVNGETYLISYSGFYLCNHCIDKLKDNTFTKYFKEGATIHYHNLYVDVEFIDIEDITEEGKKFFDLENVFS